MTGDDIDILNNFKPSSGISLNNLADICEKVKTLIELEDMIDENVSAFGVCVSFGRNTELGKSISQTQRFFMDQLSKKYKEKIEKEFFDNIVELKRSIVKELADSYNIDATDTSAFRDKGKSGELISRLTHTIF